METSKATNLKELVKYSDNSIVSTKILENKNGGQTLFAFDKDQKLSEHSTPFDAIVQIIEGEGEILIAGKAYLVHEGGMIIMPANIPHAVNANKPFKMLLTMIKG
ncbi:MAG: cupin domain-containing protein [Bacteriovoracaceae bacterium]|nr:cupin domain-containing protein [Bacteriovoracaceae bacterium]